MKATKFGAFLAAAGLSTLAVALLLGLSAPAKANPINDPPVADPNGPYVGFVGESIIFDGSGSSDPDGSIVLYEWDFEDDGVFDFSSVSATAFHTYSLPGLFDVNLRVTDDSGLSDFDATTVTVTTRVPEPDTLALFAFGLAGLGIMRRRRIT
jgi:hypothetical protein